ncbi:hypothetical protein VTO42DRAFT_295 [Malbranchea cinnamomea]
MQDDERKETSAAEMDYAVNDDVTRMVDDSGNLGRDRKLSGPLEERPLNTVRTGDGLGPAYRTNERSKLHGLGLQIAESEGNDGHTNGHWETNVQSAENVKGKRLNGDPELGSSDPMVLLSESHDDHVVKTDAGYDIDPAATTDQRTTGKIEDYTTAPEERPKSKSNSPSEPIPSLSPRRDKDGVLKLSAAKIQELTSSPESLRLRRIPSERDRSRTVALPPSISPLFFPPGNALSHENLTNGMNGVVRGDRDLDIDPHKRRKSGGGKDIRLEQPPEFLELNCPTPADRKRQHQTRTVSTPSSSGRRQSSPGAAGRQVHSWSSRSKTEHRNAPNHLRLETGKGSQIRSSAADPPNPPSPNPMSIPLPPFSIPTYLQLELSSERPSPLYIHQPVTKDFPYESSQVKLERLLNFLLLPPALEKVLWFGTLACLDSWLHSFTILPLRFGKAIFILLQSWAVNLSLEAQEISSFVVKGIGRMWRRRRSRSTGKDSVKPTPLTAPTSPSVNTKGSEHDSKNHLENGRRRHHIATRQHRRTKSIPSALLPDDKADILKGLLMIFTCIILMYFDASRVYHWIRGQAAIKLYVIYNVLEVGDRLFSAIGQDVLECLFSREALERKPDGRSKVMRPFWLFILALIYSVIHATALFYQVMTLNVAVNSYSNALITLLLSNQFVEIKSTVFKKFEKENLFQLTCADVVERFQLWLMLLIIASRNFVETGGFNFGSPLTMLAKTSPSPSTNSTPPSVPPRTTASILPKSFTLFPSSIFSSLSSVNSFLPTIGHVLGPFLVVLGSEMLVDWLKHAYINKFNNYRPAMYGRFLDILAKDYYTNAFADQNLNRRLGLPIIPISCLFIRVSIQTYQMFLTAWLPPAPSSFPPSNTTSLSSIHSYYSASASPSPSPVASTLSQYLPPPLPTSLAQISTFFHSAISHAMPSPASFVPIFTVILVLLLYVTLLLAKLVLGMVLLSYSRARYKSMKLREREVYSFAPSAAPSTTHATSSHNQQSFTAPIPQSHAVSHADDNANNAAGNVNVDNFVVAGSKRFGGWGAVEVDDEKRAWIYADDPDGLRAMREREERAKAPSRTGGKGGKASAGDGIEGVRRYEMVAKRIW